MEQEKLIELMRKLDLAIGRALFLKDGYHYVKYLDIANEVAELRMEINK